MHLPLVPNRPGDVGLAEASARVLVSVREDDKDHLLRAVPGRERGQSKRSVLDGLTDCFQQSRPTTWDQRAVVEMGRLGNRDGISNAPRIGRRTAPA